MSEQTPREQAVEVIADTLEALDGADYADLAGACVSALAEHRMQVVADSRIAALQVDRARFQDRTVRAEAAVDAVGQAVDNDALDADEVCERVTDICHRYVRGEFDAKEASHEH